MTVHSTKRSPGSSTMFDRACAVLCLLLLCFSVGHAVVGHPLGAQAELYSATASVSQQVAAPAAEGPDACVVCAAMASAVPLRVFCVDVPQTAQPRPPVLVAIDGPVTGWHASLSCRPPPVA